MFDIIVKDEPKKKRDIGLAFFLDTVTQAM